VGLAGHVKRDRDNFANDVAARFGDSFRDKLDVQVVADGGHRTGLVVAEQVTGATDLEVPHGDLEAASERRVVTDRAQSFVGRFGQDAIGRVKEIRVGPGSGATDATTQLVQLTDPSRSARSTINVLTEGILDPRLDDGRTDQDVVVSVPKVVDHPFEGSPRPSGRGPRRCARRGTSRPRR
jgi:hypothetical protein